MDMAQRTVTTRRATASPPKSRTGLIVGGALGLLVIVGAIIVFLKPSDPQILIDEFASRIKDAEALGEVERDEAFHRLLDDTTYQSCARLRAQLTKRHAQTHDHAQLEKEARRECASFIDEANRLTDDALRKRAVEIHDRARAFISRYATTSVEPALREIAARAEGLLPPPRKWPGEWVQFTRDVDNAADFARAFTLIAEFATRHREAEDSMLKSQLDEVRLTKRNSAQAHVNNLIARARELVKTGKRSEAVQLLASALPGLDHPAIQSLKAQVEGYLRELRS